VNLTLFLRYSVFYSYTLFHVHYFRSTKITVVPPVLPTDSVSLVFLDLNSDRYATLSQFTDGDCKDFESFALPHLLGSILLPLCLSLIIGPVMVIEFRLGKISKCLVVTSVQNILHFAAILKILLNI
jgi:hypothetical protein